eukprot:12908380-Prorocentrum_lima.AAC.1
MFYKQQWQMRGRKREREREKKSLAVVVGPARKREGLRGREGLSTGLWKAQTREREREAESERVISPNES